jgi:hypothetical protein
VPGLCRRPDRGACPAGQLGASFSQTWRLLGATLRTSAGLCLTATSSRHQAIVRISRCTGTTLQNWQAGPFAQLYNSGAHRCLADPLALPASDKPGIVLIATACAASRGQGWFKP